MMTYAFSHILYVIFYAPNSLLSSDLDMGSQPRLLVNQDIKVVSLPIFCFRADAMWVMKRASFV